MSQEDAEAFMDNLDKPIGGGPVDDDKFDDSFDQIKQQ